MSITFRPEDLLKEANELSPVITAARRVVDEQSKGVDSDGAPGIASKLINAAIEAQRTLADVRKYPAGRRAEADEILLTAERAYSDWKGSIDVVETVYLADLRVAIFKAPTGTEALIARSDAEQVLRRNDLSLNDVFRTLVAAGGALSQLALSPWLELVATGRNADAKALRIAAEAAFIQREANNGNETARKLQAAPTAYAKLRAAMAKLAAECTGVNRSAFAERALSWGSANA
ncbi:hypothetical protein G5C60_26510 [Streptomyces sp. HC44]|uniref:Uncharacterized protein n=1 Tax=Streptomyces scabichelini TaxID=2711217 RepID=A0A6G4VAH5_9ACTN|nr:hypothetical protein [Streptomyces scabichelini]NGO11056.1 hypothetical protein [Streptomyces scabichelini]